MNYDDENNLTHFKAEMDWKSFKSFCELVGLVPAKIASESDKRVLYDNIRPLSAASLERLKLADVTTDYQQIRTRVVRQEQLQSVVAECLRDGYRTTTVSAPHDGLVTIIFERV